MNFPEEHTKSLEEGWDRLWRKMKGVRTVTLKANIFFKQMEPAYESSEL